MSWTLLAQSLLVAAGTMVLAVSFGFLAALGLMTFSPKSRTCGLALTAAALVQPPFLSANTWLHYLGLNGVWRSWLPFDISSMGGAIWLLSLLTWPLAALLAFASWKAIDPSHLEMDPALAGRALIRWLLGPLAWPYLKIALGLTFVLALNNFTIPAILQVKVLPASLWVDFNTTFRYQTALAQGWPLILFPLLLLAVLLPHSPPIPWSTSRQPVSTRLWRARLGGPAAFVTRAAWLALALLSVGLPLGQLLFSRRTWSEIPIVLQSSPGPVWNSFLLAFLTATGCLLVACALRHWRHGRLLWLPLLIPGVLLGILFIHIFNRPGLNVLYPSTALVVVAWMLRYQAFTWQGLNLAQQRIDPELRDAALLGGAGRLSVWRHVDGPALAPLAAATGYLTYLCCLWDVETLILLLPPGGETLALRVFNLLHYGHNAQVNAMCLLLLALALLPLAVWSLGTWLRAQWVRTSN